MTIKAVAMKLEFLNAETFIVEIKDEHMLDSRNFLSIHTKLSKYSNQKTYVMK